ncbi:MAG TPA: preprotein translocase subunit Sec61beta [Candidatus Caldiarchaeum subterraneum]|uniref:Preprotein translocase subunit SecG n=1 Tax=Caldiarchaeum subterraneum TaxID=311458 RepID=A0A832ZV46_CALS0|nr:preprotein translocase subunit Sec61beta [Candidatus Caldarchaeum subterraneum]
MSSRRRRDAPLPASAAGLLRFFEDESRGIKIRPEFVVIAGAALIAIVTILRIIAPI